MTSYQINTAKKISEVYANKGWNGVYAFLRRHNVRAIINPVSFASDTLKHRDEKTDWIKQAAPNEFRAHLYSVGHVTRKNRIHFNELRAQEVHILEIPRGPKKSVLKYVANNIACASNMLVVMDEISRAAVTLTGAHMTGVDMFRAQKEGRPELAQRIKVTRTYNLSHRREQIAKILFRYIPERMKKVNMYATVASEYHIAL